MLEQWVVTVRLSEAHCPPPPHHPQMPGSFPVHLPHAGSWTDAEERGWIRAGGRGDSVPGWAGCQGWCLCQAWCLGQVWLCPGSSQVGEGQGGVLGGINLPLTFSSFTQDSPHCRGR